MQRMAGWLLAALLPFPAAADQPMISAKIDLAAEDGGQQAVMDLAQALPGFPTIVNLDLQILPNAEGEVRVALSVPDAAAPVPLDCRGNFGFVTGSYTELHLPLSEIYPHLVLQVRLDGLNEADGLVMSCDYAGGEAGTFHLQGAFVISKAEIPTAQSFLLSARPIQ